MRTWISRSPFGRSRAPSPRRENPRARSRRARVDPDARALARLALARARVGGAAGAGVLGIANTPPMVGGRRPNRSPTSPSLSVRRGSTAQPARLAEARRASLRSRSSSPARSPLLKASGSLLARADDTSATSRCQGQQAGLMSNLENRKIRQKAGLESVSQARNPLRRSNFDSRARRLACAPGRVAAASSLARDGLCVCARQKTA